MSCRREAREPAPRPGDLLPRAGDEICVAGQLFHTTTPVILWTDPRGYDAYRAHRHLDPEHRGPTANPDRIARFGSFRRGLPEEVAARVKERGWSLDDLREVVTQVVIHYDACGTSRRCFEVLHDSRGLSCHFLLDVDGTIYQTLDLKERAWHASQANDRSIGIEIAHIGARTDREILDEWYTRDDEGVRITLPDSYEGGGLPEGFVGRPRSPDPVRGTINGQELIQYDFTEEQYVALERLLVTLRRIFPLIEADAPRRDGDLRADAFATDEELFSFRGILGHQHVTRGKVDPGPAFDWDRVLGALRTEEE